MEIEKAKQILNECILQIQICFKVNKNEAIKILTDYIKNREPKK